MSHIVPLNIVAEEAIEQLLDAAFGPDRHGRTAYLIRDGMPWVPELSFGMMDEHGELAGSLQSWPVALTHADGTQTPLIMVGPVAVSPTLQRTGHGRALTLYQVNGMGDTIRVATLPGSAQSIPDSVRQAMIDRYTASPRFAAVVHAPDVPTAHPLFTALDVDELGRLWIHRPGPDGSPAHFEVLDSTGIWLGTVRAPRGAARSPHWAHGRMYRIGETAGGMPAIEIYRLEGPRP